MPTLSKADQVARISQNEARRRKELALAEIRELERDEKLKRLVPADQVQDAWLKILAALRTGVLRIPDNAALAVASTTDAREARRILLRECEAILKALSDDVQRLAESGTLGRGGAAEAPRTRVTRRMGRRKLPAE